MKEGLWVQELKEGKFEINYENSVKKSGKLTFYNGNKFIGDWKYGYGFGKFVEAHNNT